MRTIVFAILAVFACLAAADSLNSVNIPAIFWSGREYFDGKGVQVLSSIHEGDIEASIDQIIHSAQAVDSVNTLGDYLQTQNQAPELLVLFVTPKLRTEQLTHYGSALSELKTALGGAESSLLIPYAFADTPFVEPLLRHLADEGNTVIVAANSQTDSLVQAVSQYNNVKFTLLSALETELQNQQHIFTNGVTDVLVVVLDAKIFPADLVAADALIGKVDAVARKQTNGNYVAVFTSNAPAVGEISKVFAAPQKRLQRFASRRDLSYDDSTTLWPHYIYEAIIVLVVLLIILYTGLSCLCAIDTPQRFEGGVRK
jgi:hypothetical protein